MAGTGVDRVAAARAAPDVNSTSSIISDADHQTIRIQVLPPDPEPTTDEVTPLLNGGSGASANGNGRGSTKSPIDSAGTYEFAGPWWRKPSVRTIEPSKHRTSGR
jgi:hypothetical protein